MKAIVFHQFGPPEGLRLEQVSAPAPGPGELLLKVHAVSVNRTLDLAVRAGQYAHRPKLPHVLGVDPCGVVAAVGLHICPRQVSKRIVWHSPIFHQPVAELLDGREVEIHSLHAASSGEKTPQVSAVGFGKRRALP